MKCALKHLSGAKLASIRKHGVPSFKLRPRNRAPLSERRAFFSVLVWKCALNEDCHFWCGATKVADVLPLSTSRPFTASSVTSWSLLESVYLHRYWTLLQSSCDHFPAKRRFQTHKISEFISFISLVNSPELTRSGCSAYHLLYINPDLNQRPEYDICCSEGNNSQGNYSFHTVACMN